MRFVTVRDFRLRHGSVWRNLEKQEDVVITSKGKPIAILTGTSNGTLRKAVSR
jgi:antitoxin (DNA-binding transcriptional repressor) of toxin-antitoxin stability system